MKENKNLLWVKHQNRKEERKGKEERKERTRRTLKWLREMRYR